MANEHIVAQIKGVSRMTVGQSIRAQQTARRLDNIEIILLNLRGEFMMMQENNHDHDWPFQEEPDGMPWASRVFGWTLDGSTLTIVNNELQSSDQGWFEAADTDLTIPDGDGAYYVGISFDGTTLSIPAPSTDKADFTSDAGSFKTWLYLWTRDDESLLLTKWQLDLSGLDAWLG